MAHVFIIVHVIQGLGNLQSVTHGIFFRQTALILQQVAQGTVTQELHDVIDGVVLLEHVSHMHNVGMVQLCQVMGLLDKLLAVLIYLVNAAG